MELATIWIGLGLVFAAIVLIAAGRVMNNDSSSDTLWRTLMEDVSAAASPTKLRLQILGESILVKFGKSPAGLKAKQALLAEVASERRRERDIAKMSRLDDTDYSNSTLDEFLSATATNEPAYADVDALSGKIETLYENVQEKRASARARK